MILAGNSGDEKEFLTRLRMLASARKRSKAQLALIAAGAQKQKKVERENNGLVILSARYGMRLSEHHSWDVDVAEPSEDDLATLSHPPNIDVTNQLMFW